MSVSSGLLVIGEGKEKYIFRLVAMLLQLYRKIS